MKKHNDIFNLICDTYIAHNNLFENTSQFFMKRDCLVELYNYNTPGGISDIFIYNLNEIEFLYNRYSISGSLNAANKIILVNSQVDDDNYIPVVFDKCLIRKQITTINPDSKIIDIDLSSLLYQYLCLDIDNKYILSMYDYIV